jgi:predicted O-linked N-acetylglucosamine transferase (SPINDLY family)
MFKNKYKQIIQWSPPRTGSTLVWQILDALFEDPEYQENKWLKPNIVKKTHALQHESLNDPTCVFITTIRNPIDSMVSYMIVKKEPFTKESILKHIDMYKSNFNLIPLVQKTQHHTILRYEEFYDNYSIIFDAVEQLFSIKIDQSIRDTISTRFSRKRNKEIADGLSGFEVWEKDSFIHGDHINSDSLSYWKTRVPGEYHDMIVSGFLTHLNKWGYRDDCQKMLQSSISLFNGKQFANAFHSLESSIEILETATSLYTIGKMHLSYAGGISDPQTTRIAASVNGIKNADYNNHRHTHVGKAIQDLSRLLDGGFSIRKEIEIQVLGYVSNCHQERNEMNWYAKRTERLGKLSGESIQYCRAGYGYLKSNSIEESIRCYYTSIYINDTNYFSYNNLAQVMSYMGSHHLTIPYREEAIRQVQRVISGEVPNIDPTHDAVHAFPVIFSNLLLDLNYVSDKLSRKYIYDRHVEYSSLFEKQLDEEMRTFSERQVSDLMSVYKETGKIRVGYMSNDFKNHCIGSLIEGCFSNANRALFDVFVYSNETVNDDVQTRLKSYPVVWNDVSTMTDKELYERVISDRVHVMLDLSGHTGMNRVRMFCYRLAPVQITYLAYPNTTGITNMDYKFTDKYLTTEQCEEFHSETLYELRHGIHNYKPDPIIFKQVTRTPFDSTKPIRFGCFNNPAKMSDTCIESFCRILNRVPNSVLCIRYHRLNQACVTQPFLSKCNRYGVPPSRIDIGYSATKEAYIQEYNTVDLCLDTFPYGSHTTLCELLWMSVPIVTLIGESFAGRVGYSILSHLGLDELITSSVDEYVDTCVALALDPTRLHGYHQTIHSLMKDHPMSDSNLFVRSLEDAYTDVWGKYMREQTGVQTS